MVAKQTENQQIDHEGINHDLRSIGLIALRVENVNKNPEFLLSF